MNTVPVLTHATERDVDLLLVEEFAASPLFTAAILRAIGLIDLGFIRSQVLHSVRRLHNRREIDISVQVETRRGKVLLLIENKLDTSEQPRQAESYRAEAEAQAGSFLHVRTILTCPEAYRAQNTRFAGAFDHVVSYEMIADFFRARAGRESGELGARMTHRANLMMQAIEKQRRGYVQVIHPAKHAFSARYVALAAKIAPELIPGPSMLRESAAESVTMIFAPETLPDWSFLPQMRIVHQLREGNANVNFYGWGDHFPEIAARVAADLAGSGIRPVPTVNKRKGGRSGLMLVVETPAIDQFADFEAQIDAVRQGIERTSALRAWVLAHKSAVQRWAAMVPKR